jgi:FecR protein
LNSDRIDTMRRHNVFFRLTASVAMSALLWDAALPSPAVAQPAPPPLPQPGQGRPDLTRGDPPARVGRVARIGGTVSFHNQGDTDWTAASVNYPVSSGNAFWTEPSADAQLEIGDSRIALSGGTELDVSALDDTGLQAVAEQGEVYLHVRALAPNEVWTVQTPRAQVRLNGPGRYDIVVGSTDQPTLVTVLEGSVQIDGPNLSLQVAGSQTATITGTDSFQGSVGPALRDPFLTANLDAERPPPAPAVPVPAQVAGLPGGGDLYRTGDWAEAPEYGQVWYPPVAAGWVPYREGHWAYVAPWGWTWIDDAPWGFAPFHYGRWIEVGNRWAWTPGGFVAERRPVYAPALVVFLGVGAGVALGAALASRSIGWVPLGPREPFRPWYHASNRYVQEVNVNHVTNFNRNITINNFANRGAATSIPAAAMTGSRPVQGVARPVSAQEFAGARPIVGQQPVRPVASTAGITPVIARQMSLAPAGTIRPAPGPAIRTQAPGAGFPRRGFAPPGNAVSPAVVQPNRPGQTSPAAGPAVIQTPPPGRPGLTPSGAGPAVIQTAPPNRPGLTPSGAAPAVIQTPLSGRPVTAPPAGPPPTTPHPAIPNVVRPTQPGGVRSEPAFAAPRPTIVTPQTAPPPGPRAPVPPAGQPAALPNVVRPTPPGGPRPEPAFVAPRPTTITPQAAPPTAPIARPEPQHFAPPAPRPEPPHAFAPPPRAEPPHFAPPAPRPEPQHFAPPAPRPEPPRAAPAHEKRPGEH